MDLFPGIVNPNEGTLIGASVDSESSQYTVRILTQPFHSLLWFKVSFAGAFCSHPVYAIGEMRQQFLDSRYNWSTLMNILKQGLDNFVTLPQFQVNSFSLV